MPSLKNADVINVDVKSAMHITNIDVMSEKHIYIDDISVFHMTSTFINISVFQT
jgi:hypothetical protein